MDCTWAAAGAAHASAARRRRERRLRAHLRYVRMSVAMAMAEATHHTAPRGQKTARARGEERDELYDAKGLMTPPPTRPPPLVEVRPQGQVQRNTVEQRIEHTPGRRGRRGRRRNFLELPLFVARVSRVLTPRFLVFTVRLRHARQASAGSSGGDSLLCLRDCRLLERLDWWLHVRQAPRRADLTGSQVASGFRAYFTCETVRSSLFYVASFSFRTWLTACEPALPCPSGGQYACRSGTNVVQACATWLRACEEGGCGMERGLSKCFDMVPQAVGEAALAFTQAPGKVRAVARAAWSAPRTCQVAGEIANKPIWPTRSIAQGGSSSPKSLCAVLSPWSTEGSKF